MVSSEYVEKIRTLKRKVMTMLQERSKSSSIDAGLMPSPIWTESMSVWNYIMNLSEEDYLNIRYHTYAVTGEGINTYWRLAPLVDAERYASDSGYKFFVEDIPQEYWIGEPPMPRMLRPIGINYRGKIINDNIIRYQSCVSNLYSMGIIKFLSGDKKSLVLEVGGGYGGLLHHVGNILSGKATCIDIDLPEMLLFSGGYLIVNNPEKKIYIYDKDTFTPGFIKQGLYEYDYILLPNYVLRDLYALPEINLMINMQSFQEMTGEQVSEYVAFGQKKLSGYFYSDNIDVHPFNNSMAPDSVERILARQFHLFPSPDFYNKRLKAGRNPWFYKQYFGVPIGKEKEIKFNEGSTIRYLIGSDGYRVYHQGSKTKFKMQRNWKKYFLGLARDFVNNIVKQ